MNVGVVLEAQKRLHPFTYLALLCQCQEFCKAEQGTFYHKESS
jgi:hypothetical protein